ncbi:MAG: hypothetical protein ABR575_05410 [Actinomycetota bacterium]
MELLVVCTGNICRSPTAEGLIRRGVAARGCRGVEVGSAGTWASAGERATAAARAVAAARGVDISAHRARPLEPGLLVAADLVLAMTSVHRREILALAPDVDAKLVLMKELAELGAPGGHPAEEGQSALEGLEKVLRAHRPRWRRALDLDDPMGMPYQVYERCFDEIERAVDALLDLICPRGSGPARTRSIGCDP